MPQEMWRPGSWPWLSVTAGPRLRVIVDNDFAGDPDDLYQVVHHLLSPSVDVRGISCSRLREGDRFYNAQDSADEARRVMLRLADVMLMDPEGLLYTGSNRALTARNVPQESEAARFIVQEALRTDTDVPLVVVCGGGLTELASAYIMEPSIADRLTAIWIGGPEHEGLGHPAPGADAVEYNLRIDLIAAQVVLNDSGIPLWLVPRNMYRQCLVSDIELRARVANRGQIGAHLYESIQKVRSMTEDFGGGFGETYALGDSPLVLLTALQSYFQPDPSSSDYVVRPCPELTDSGEFAPGSEGRPVRVFTRVDTRLMFEDMFLKIDELATWLSSNETA